MKAAHAELIGYEEAIAEVYRMHQVKDDAFIYQAEKDSRFYYEEGLKEIYKNFQKDSAKKETKTSGNHLYHAMRYICEKRKIEIASYELIRKTEGKKFSVEDVARISNFVVRQVTLEGRWYKKDGGYLVAFLEEGKQAVVCEPTGAGAYRMVHAETKESKPINAEVAGQMMSTAYVIYRPLSDEKLGIRQLVQFMAKEISYRDLVRYMAMVLTGTVLGVLLTELNRWIFDQFIPQRDLTGLVQVGGMLFCFTVGGVLFRVVQNLAAFRYSAIAKHDLQAAVYHRTLNLPQSVLGTVDSADLAGRIMGFSELCVGMMSSCMTAVTSVVMSVVYLVLMLRYSKSMTLAGIWMLVFYFLITYVLSKRKARYIEERLGEKGKLDSELYQYLFGIEKIRLSGTENNVLYRYICHLLGLKRLEHTENRYEMAEALLGTVMGTLLPVIMCFMVAFAGVELSTGDYMAFNSAYGAFSGGVISLAGIYTGFLGLLPEWKRMSVMLDYVPETSQGVVRPDKITGQIDIDHVTFAYDKEEGDVLKGVTVHIRSGEYVGIVGASGSGKSTLMRLLLGFHMPDKGRIYYDHMDLATLDKREIRKKMGVVLQNASLISGSIAENIAITCPGIAREKINQIIHKVGLKKDIEAMPMGLNTVLDAENPTISGGQKQRILIARALVNEPRIIFFDEATSALDNITQNLVCDTLKNMDATRIVVAHRLS
ncbi:MAG: ATP-binding cassette domain-containing protein, partial [Lachnospiraceae bacterium]|nr:ATP-binding cassette domain-containing protein [Lachnospiraceae bacterium]